jgi:hypothetical protein
VPKAIQWTHSVLSVDSKQQRIVQVLLLMRSSTAHGSVCTAKFISLRTQNVSANLQGKTPASCLPEELKVGARCGLPCCACCRLPSCASLSPPSAATAAAAPSRAAPAAGVSQPQLAGGVSAAAT